MISLKDVSYYISGKLLLSDVNFQVSDKQHIGLVGRNGTGKSTLFKLINRQLQNDDGKIEITGGWKILSVKQEVPNGDITPKEYSILELLCLRKGATLTKDMFLNHLYGGIDEPELKIIDVFVCKLRKKLMDALDGECYIETIWGRGYTIKDIDSQSSDEVLEQNHDFNTMSGVPGTV